MTVLTEETKAQRMREALGKLAGEYIGEGRVKQSGKVQKVAVELDGENESLAKLYDIIAAHATR